MSQPFAYRLPRAALCAALCAGLALGLAACGKKGAPKPPEGEEAQYTYPQPYPAPKTVLPPAEGAEENRGPVSIFTDDDRTTTKSY